MGLTNLIKSMPKDLDTKEIFMTISEYDDLFSDFDSKPIIHRSLSDDFLQELKKESTDSFHKKIDLKLIVPDNKRDTRLEVIVKRRIEEYFKMRFKRLNQERRMLIISGVSILIIGLIILITKNSAVSFFEHYGLELLPVILEPISWFLFWEGSYLIFFETKKNYSEYNLFKKISKAKITFKTNDY